MRLEKISVVPHPQNIPPGYMTASSRSLPAPRRLRPAGICFEAGRPTLWLFDGFNLYHSLRQSEADSGRKLRWLDLASLARNHQYIMGKDAELAELHYFTAIPHHFQGQAPETLERHRTYLRAITSGPLWCRVHLGHFQPRRLSEGRLWEEKGTDMAIATQVMRACVRHERPSLVVVSGDSDFVPLAEFVREAFPRTDLRFAFPAHRASRKLRLLCPQSFALSCESYARAQFPDEIRLPSGKMLTCPASWRNG